MPVIVIVLFFANTSCADVRIDEHALSIGMTGYVFLTDPVMGALGDQAVAHERRFLLLPADGRISSLYGWRRDPLGAGRRFHAGIDFANLRDSIVRAAAAGRVSFAGWASDCGWMAVVAHGGGLGTRYCHLQMLAVKAGEEVKAGTIIGGMGATGRSTGPHLHFEVLEDGAAVDPALNLMF
ncbi:MAG: M23 family metallopeptidase [Pseudomonadota bacterium]